MNTNQTVFLVFFAIAWGAVANVQGKWKAFHWPFVNEKPARSRVLLSMIYLNILPLAYAVFALWCLSGPDPDSVKWTPRAALDVLLFGFFPAFAAFAFHRLWLARIEANPGRYYYPKKQEKRDAPTGAWRAAFLVIWGIFRELALLLVVLFELLCKPPSQEPSYRVTEGEIDKPADKKADDPFRDRERLWVTPKYSRGNHAAGLGYLAFGILFSLLKLLTK